MKVLIVSSCPTHPVTAGNRKAILNQVELFKDLGHDVYFLYIDERPLRSKSIDLSEMYEYWGSNIFVHKVTKVEHAWRLLLKRYRLLMFHNYSHTDDYFPLTLNRTIKKLNQQYNFDCCIVNYYFLSKALLFKDIPLRGLYTHDYFAYKDELVNNPNVGYNTNAHQEAKALKRAPHIFALNSEEANYFQRLSPKSKIYVTYSSYTYFPSEYVGNKSLLFFSGDNEFNLNGLRWFIDDVFPIIKASVPDIKLIVGGSICKKIKEYENDTVILKGFVRDPREFYNLGDVVINPTYEGTGLKIKTFEGISYGKVVMAHPHSATGIFSKDTAPVFISSDRYMWAEFLKETIGNKSKVCEIKALDEQYIQAMNEHIKKEYMKFFKSIDNPQE